MEYALTVRPSHHKPNEVSDLQLGDSPPSSGFLPVSSDLVLNHAGQPEAAWQGQAHVLVVQDLTGSIPIPDCLEKSQRKLGLYTPTVTFLRQGIGQDGSHGSGDELATIRPR